MMSLRRIARGRAVTLAVGAGVIGSLAFAAPSIAAPPNAGVNCVADAAPGGGISATNGKIDGHGATFARQFHIVALIPGYRQHVCGPVADEHHPSDMILYNETQVSPPQPAGLPTWPLASTTIGPPCVGTIGLNCTGISPPTARVGSGAGILGNKCRTAAFNMSDTPYSLSQQQQTRLDPDTFSGQNLTDCQAITNDVNFNPPYQPSNAAAGGATDFPVLADTTAGNPLGTMSFPLGGGAIALGINLDATDCPGIPGAVPAVDLTPHMVSGLYGGTIETWADAELGAVVGGRNPDLRFCTGVLVKRVVRQDNSGTTTQYKNYLVRADPQAAPNPRICNNTQSWPTAPLTTNQTWPTGAACPAPGTGGELIVPAGAGGNQVVAETNARPGAIGYADLENWLQAPQADVTLARMQPQAGGVGVVPASGQASNCNFAPIEVTPGIGANGAVGLNTANWATDAAPNRSNLTFLGSTYPVCALTWALVYPGLNGNNPAVNPISRLTANQRRTLFSYMVYALSPLGQLQLNLNGYAGQGITVLNRIRDGFIANY